MAGRTVTGVTDCIDFSVEIDSLTLATTCRTDRRRHDGPSQARRPVTGTTARHRLRKSQAELDFLTRFKGRFWTILSLIRDFVGLY